MVLALYLVSLHPWCSGSNFWMIFLHANVFNLPESFFSGCICHIFYFSSCHDVFFNVSFLITWPKKIFFLFYSCMQCSQQSPQKHLCCLWVLHNLLVHTPRLSAIQQDRSDITLQFYVSDIQWNWLFTSVTFLSSEYKQTTKQESAYHWGSGISNLVYRADPVVYISERKL